MFRKILNWFANNILTILFTVIPFILGVSPSISAYSHGRITELDLFFIVALLIVVIAVVAYFLWNVFSYRSYRYPFFKIHSNYTFEVLEKTISYKRTKKDSLHYERKMKIKCRTNCLNYIFDKYIWTGSQNNTVTIQPVTEISLIRDKSRIGIWRYILLELQNHMDMGDVREISYKWPVLPDCKKSSPFFSTSTDEPTKKIYMKLDLGKEYANQEIVCEVFRAIESDYPIYSEACQLDDYGRFTWDVKRVKRFRYYRIRWSWIVGQTAGEMDSMDGMIDYGSEDDSTIINDRR